MSAATRPTFRELFTPKLVTVLREGYGPRQLRADAVAGLTVAIVALPLSMAIAIASGTSPAAGLYAAVVGGFLVSALGGSRFQIGGPAGAFIVLVAATVQQHGLDGLLLATLIGGLVLLAAGLLQLGTYIKFIPYPVTVGFTAGIAVIIFASQLKELLGLTLAGPEPGPVLDKLRAFAAAADTARPAAVAVAVLSIALIVGLKRWRPHWPGMLVAVVTGSVVVAALQLPVETIGSRFGGIPASLPAPSLPPLSLEKLQAVLPSALSFALLGAIESLLSAVVADGMTGRRHRSNCELAAQGVANVAAALVGGLCVTGTIARTATNVRAGAQGPVSGMLHAVFLLAFLLVAAPLARFIPLATLAGVLAVVSWNMVEKHAFKVLLRTRGEAIVLLVTLVLTIFRDLTEGILAGFAIGTMLFLHRMSNAISIEQHIPFIADDQADGTAADRERYDPAAATNPDVLVYRISGAFFFGAASTVASVLDRIADRPKLFVLDFSSVPFLDATAANTIAGAAATAERTHVPMVITGASPTVRRELHAHGVRAPRVRFAVSVEAALAELG